jgi:hypothetical protein
VSRHIPPSGANTSPQALLDQLARHTLRSAPSPHRVSCAAVAYHAHLRFAAPRLLEDVKAAAGHNGPAVADEARSRLAGWTAAHPRRARDVAAHAGMLLALMAQFSFECVIVLHR